MTRMFVHVNSNVYIAVVLWDMISQLHADKCDYQAMCRQLSYLLANNGSVIG